MFFDIFKNIFDGLLCVYFEPYFGNRPDNSFYNPQLCFTRYGVYVIIFNVLYRIFVPPPLKYPPLKKDEFVFVYDPVTSHIYLLLMKAVVY